MALVSLESYLFSGTLKDNLSVAKDASEKEMNSVLEKVGILDFVHEQGGLNMHIEKRPFMETKTFCSQCKVHCYKKDKREQIRKVMRFLVLECWCIILSWRFVICTTKLQTNRKNMHKSKKYSLKICKNDIMPSV